MYSISFTLRSAQNMCVRVYTRNRLHVDGRAYSVVCECSDPICLVFQVLDVYAALACVEHLEPRKPRVLETDAQRQAWLQRVKKLQVPVELICSEDSVRRFREKSKTIASRVR